MEIMTFVEMELEFSSIRQSIIIINVRLTLPSMATTGTPASSPISPNASALLCPTTIDAGVRHPRSVSEHNKPTGALREAWNSLVWNQYRLAQALHQSTQS